jgi:phage baseplate assembly protein gpV
MHPLLNQIRQQAGNILNNVAFTRTGIVNTFDGTSFTCVVQYEPENSESDVNSLSPALPIAAFAIGNGFGVLAAPNIGDRVVVHFIEGSENAAFVCCGLFNDIDNPPNISAGEYYLIHQNGSFVKLMNTGELLLNGNTKINLTGPQINITTTGDVNVTAGGNLNANITGGANIIAQGDSTISGANTTITGGTVTLSDGTATADALAKFNELKAAYDAHIHPDPQGGNTGTPTTPLPSSVGTSIVSGA